MATSDNDLIVGRKQIMVLLRYENWRSVEKLINRQGCPVKKVEGRWLAMKSELWDWLGLKMTPKKCKSLSTFTNIDNVGQDKHRRRRGQKMPQFIEYYREGHSVSKACFLTGISRPTFYTWRKRYERFDMACKQIEQEVSAGELMS